MKKRARAKLAYQNGFGNTFSSEAVSGALPLGGNAPQRYALQPTTARC